MNILDMLYASREELTKRVENEMARGLTQEEAISNIVDEVLDQTEAEANTPGLEHGIVIPMEVR